MIIQSSYYNLGELHASHSGSSKVSRGDILSWGWVLNKCLSWVELKTTFEFNSQDQQITRKQHYFLHFCQNINAYVLNKCKNTSWVTLVTPDSPLPELFFKQTPIEFWIWWFEMSSEFFSFFDLDLIFAVISIVYSNLHL